MSRPTATVESENFYSVWHKQSERQNLPIISADELNTFHVKYLLKQKPPGLSGMKDSHYLSFLTTNSVPKDSGLKASTIYAVSVRDFRNVLAGKNHVPNKKESKVLRQKKAKL